MITWRGETDAEKGFLDELNRQNCPVSIQKYHADQSTAKLKEIIRQIKKHPTDLIYVFGTSATQTVISEIKDMPVVFNIVTQPVASGIVQSWTASGNNATGVSSYVPVEYQLKALKKVFDFKRLGIIYNPKEPNSIFHRNSTANLQQRLDFTLHEFKIDSPQKASEVLKHLEGAVDAVFVPSDSLLISMGDSITGPINTCRIPSLTTAETLVVDHGLLLGLQPSYYTLGSMVARKAMMIFEGKKPGNIPISRLDYFELRVNMRTASQIGVQIPMAILVGANRIVR